MLTNSQTAICGNQDNPDLFGKVLTGKILCFPKSIGSTSAGATWDRVSSMGIAPKAVLISERIDSLSAAGLIISEIWAGKRICTVDKLGEEFLNQVKTGQHLVIEEDGRVTIS
jgi:predicted aconitase with swiveling domain